MSDWFPSTHMKTKITTKINQEMYVRGIFRALEKASDHIFHEILLTNLHLYGIHGMWVNWVTFCPRNRKREIEIAAYNSP